MLDVLLPDSQPNKKIYELFENLISLIKSEEWIFFYIFFELSLIKELGYDPNLNDNQSTINKDINKLKIDGYIYEVPNYLISKKIPKNFSNLLIRKSLYFTRQIFQNKFFIPNNIVFPKSRVILENYYN